MMFPRFIGGTSCFYAGTQAITDDDFTGWVLQNDAAPLRIGSGLNGENPFHGNMMEVRVWTKPLTPAEIANTHMRCLAPGTVNIRFYNRTQSSAHKREAINVAFSNPHAAANMTMIARIDMYPPSLADQVLRVYVGDELAAVATQIDSLYYLTIQSDQVGNLRFEMGGETYVPESGSINYSADVHHGSLKAPIVLMPVDSNRPYKIIDNGHVIIIRAGDRYDVTGQKL